MKTLVLVLSILLNLLLFSLLFVRGCPNKQEYLELDRKTLFQMEAAPTSRSYPRFRLLPDKEIVSKWSKTLVKEIDFVGPLSGQSPEQWEGVYRNLFPVINSLKINMILRCIKDAKPAEHQTNYKILFITESKIYYLGIDWDNEKVYGDWWESVELLSYFKSWRVNPVFKYSEKNKASKGFGDDEVFDLNNFDPNDYRMHRFPFDDSEGYPD